MIVNHYYSNTVVEQVQAAVAFDEAGPTGDEHIGMDELRDTVQSERTLPLDGPDESLNGRDLGGPSE